MIFELRQNFSMESARFLPHLPSSHPCSRMHGHSFKITLVWQGTLDPTLGWVQDYHEIHKQIEPILKDLDHQVLNTVPGLENPTSEHLCAYLFYRVKKWLPQLTQVIVKETPDTECRCPI
jgi:6-pyruvoyltetrahydropterin/6-carboxytetrahydropterin synthase